MRDGIKFSSTCQTLLVEHMAQTISRLFVFKSTPIVVFAASTSRTDCIPRRNCRQSSSSSFLLLSNSSSNLLRLAWAMACRVMFVPIELNRSENTYYNNGLEDRELTLCE